MLQCEGIGSDIMSKTDNVNGYNRSVINWEITTYGKL